MYFDINVPAADKVLDDARLQTLKKFGFDAYGFAVTCVGNDKIPPPLPVSPSSNTTGPTPHHLNRLTVQVPDAGMYYLTNQLQAINTWDVVAAMPMSEKAFLAVCERAEVDIVSLDLGNRMPFKLKAQQIHAALARGMFFEIPVDAMLRDAGARRHLIANARTIVRATNGKGVILTSGATDPMLMRSPHEICALGYLCGLQHDQAVIAMTVAPQMALDHAKSRKAFRTVIGVEEMAS
eukprot:TRINITY_DN2736_c0_g1_i1.p1 TRINITY_DN2736_c0_g1~~TRINITY_DN2736_c0_g1_i1.p1  ORF type:complete len:237 (-),score=53.10 TRINITY_DN2736_c0_g1_i1:277-987(-)